VYRRFCPHQPGFITDEELLDRFERETLTGNKNLVEIHSWRMSWMFLGDIVY
jgi:hypothetical protein